MIKIGEKVVGVQYDLSRGSLGRTGFGLGDTSTETIGAENLDGFCQLIYCNGAVDGFFLPNFQAG